MVQPWHSDGDLPYRRQIIQEIYMFFERSPEVTRTAEWQQTFPSFVRRLEFVLYLCASSLEEYADPTTVVFRLRNIANHLHRQRLDQQQQLGEQIPSRPQPDDPPTVPPVEMITQTPQEFQLASASAGESALGPQQYILRHLGDPGLFPRDLVALGSSREERQEPATYVGSGVGGRIGGSSGAIFEGRVVGTGSVVPANQEIGGQAQVYVPEHQILRIDKQDEPSGEHQPAPQQPPQADAAQLAFPEQHGSQIFARTASGRLVPVRSLGTGSVQGIQFAQHDSLQRQEQVNVSMERLEEARQLHAASYAQTTEAAPLQIPVGQMMGGVVDLPSIAVGRGMIRQESSGSEQSGVQVQVVQDHVRQLQLESIGEGSVPGLSGPSRQVVKVEPVSGQGALVLQPYATSEVLAPSTSSGEVQPGLGPDLSELLKSLGCSGM